jgi:hypothetical protein
MRALLSLGLVGVKVGGNQTQLPVIQTADGNITQLQQNSNKVLRNINNQVTDLQTSINQMTIIGEVKIANLTVDQFKSIAGTNWLLCNGQTCVGTTYSNQTKNNTVPNISLGSINNFIRVD